MSNFSPMHAGEEDIFTVDFAPLLAVGETLVSPVWTISPVDGVDPNASAMIVGTASISGTKVSQMIKGGVPGVRYAPMCTTQTSIPNRKLIMPEYGLGELYVTP